MNPIELFNHPNRSTALLRLQAFLPHAGRLYESRRNHDLGSPDHTNVSMLSPFIRHRLITEQEVLSAVLARHSFAAAEKFVQEVFWRTYFKGYLETRPFIWNDYCQGVIQKTDELGRSAGLRKAYEHAIDGKTGIDCFDSWVEELRLTGYLHNHARMWFASIWIFTLRLPWQLGADFMLRHLLDGDPASNTLSWRWVGGLHTKGKTYLARSDNINTYTQGRFSPKGLALEARPLEEAEVPKARPLREATASWPSGKVGLLLTHEDLHPQLPDPGTSKIAALASVNLASEQAPFDAAPLVKHFVDSAISDGSKRFADQLSVEAKTLSSFSSSAIMDWAKSENLNTIVTPYAPVGPVASQLQMIAPELRNNQIQLIEVRRNFDTLSWPHATRGFFGLKEKIPKLLETLAIVTGNDAAQLNMFESAQR